MRRRRRGSGPVLLATALAVALTGGAGALWRQTETVPAGRCGYARITVTVKAAYQLAVTVAERDALQDLLAGLRG